MFPVLNCLRIYINQQCITLLFDNNRSLIVSFDAWEILKYCDGTRNIKSIFEIVNIDNDISEEKLNQFLNRAERNNVIKIIEYPQKVDLNVFGDKNKYFPQAVSIELTNICNLKCSYCYGDYKTNEGEYINYEEIEKLFETLKRNGIITIELTGGEPLMHPRFKDIFLLALADFSRVNVLSNGVLFNEDIFDIIEKHKEKVLFQISIDGITEETNLKVRRVKNTWGRTLKTIKRLRDIGVFCRIPFMITTDNFHEIPAMCELFRKEKLRNLAISQVTLYGRACENLECGFDNEKKEEFFEVIKVSQEKYPEIFYNRPTYGKDLPIVDSNCGAGWKLVTVSPNGNIRSCVMLDENGTIGNIFEQDISSIFKSDKVKFYANFSKTRDEDACKRCQYQDYCQRCISRIYTANIQRLNNGLELCEIAKRNKMDAFLNFNSNFKFVI